MDVYYFRADLTPHLAPLIEELCLTEGLPYTVDLENHCDPVINDFFISLVGPRTRCTRTWGTYAQQLSFFFRFLDSRAISWRGVTQDDLLHYYRIRRVVDGSLKVSAPSWKVFVAAIRCFYEWALRKGYVSVVPFEYKEVRSGANYATPRRTLTAINITERARKRDLKYLTEEEFRERLLPAVTGTKHGIRNALFVRLLMRSGLRADEAVTLTLSMLPDPDDPRYAGRKTCPMRVTGKGQKERTVRVPKSWLRDAQRYVEWDRADAVERWANKYPKQTPLSGGHRDRLFLTSQGTPISYSAVYDMMRKCGAKAG